MDEKQPETIEVTVDMSRIVTIGEWLYSESIELIRELVNNAYDADAEVVKVFIAEDSIVVENFQRRLHLPGVESLYAYQGERFLLTLSVPSYNISY